MRRQSCELHVLHVLGESLNEAAIPNAFFENLKAAYPIDSMSHCRLEDILSGECMDIHDGQELLSSLPQTPNPDDGSMKPTARLRAILSSLPSSTSRQDLRSVLRSRLIMRQAKLLHCDTVTWGDSTTRLAERALSETAKGRGFALPLFTDDGVSSNGLFNLYPLKDLLRKELEVYAMLTIPTLYELVTSTLSNPRVLKSSRNATIDELMGSFFQSVEQHHPSIVANVVKTSNRLLSVDSWQGRRNCTICSTPFNESSVPSEIRDGIQRPVSDTECKDYQICYGCSRSIRT